jgi:hypothetical protein
MMRTALLLLLGVTLTGCVTAEEQMRAQMARQDAECKSWGRTRIAEIHAVSGDHQSARGLSGGVAAREINGTRGDGRRNDGEWSLIYDSSVTGMFSSKVTICLDRGHRGQLDDNVQIFFEFQLGC